MAEQSPRMQWPFPSEDADPWFDAFVDFVRGLDASGFAGREDRNLILAGGGTLTWNAGGPGLNWSAPLIIFSPSTGFHVQLQPATLNPADGEVIRFDTVRNPGQNTNVTPEVASIAKNTDNSVILAVRIGTKIYFRNGTIMSDGSSGGLGEPPASGGRFVQSFGSGDLVGGVLSVNHSLGSQVVLVSVYDDSNQLVIPDAVTLVDTNNLDVDLSSFTVAMSGWNVLVRE